MLRCDCAPSSPGSRIYSIVGRPRLRNAREFLAVQIPRMQALKRYAVPTPHVARRRLYSSSKPAPPRSKQKMTNAVQAQSDARIPIPTYRPQNNGKLAGRRRAQRTETVDGRGVAADPDTQGPRRKHLSAPLEGPPTNLVDIDPPRRTNLRDCFTPQTNPEATDHVRKERSSILPPEKTKNKESPRYSWVVLPRNPSAMLRSRTPGGEGSVNAQSAKTRCPS